MDYGAGAIDAFVTAAFEGSALLQPYALNMLFLLATIAIVVTFALGALTSAFNPLATLIAQILKIGLLYWFVTTWPTLLDQVIRGAVFLGSQVGGGDPQTVLKPMSIIPYGWDVSQTLFRRAGDLSGPVAFFENFGEIAVLMVCGFLIVIAYVVLAGIVAVALVEFWVGAAAALVLIPFAVLGPTAFIAQAAFGWVASNAVKLLLLTTLLGIGQVAIATLPIMDPRATEIMPGDAISALAVAVFFLMLGWRASAVASGLIGGRPALGGGALYGTALGVGTAAAAGGAIGTAAVRGAAGMAAGGGSASMKAALGYGSRQAGDIVARGRQASRHSPDQQG